MEFNFFLICLLNWVCSEATQLPVLGRCSSFSFENFGFYVAYCIMWRASIYASQKVVLLHIVIFFFLELDFANCWRANFVVTIFVPKIFFGVWYTNWSYSFFFFSLMLYKCTESTTADTLTANFVSKGYSWLLQFPWFVMTENVFSRNPASFCGSTSSSIFVAIRLFLFHPDNSSLLFVLRS